jgi:hypothetical protein
MREANVSGAQGKAVNRVIVNGVRKSACITPTVISKGMGYVIITRSCIRSKLADDSLPHSNA